MNVAAHLVLLECERGDLNAARDDASTAIARAEERGWAGAPQAVSAYLALAWVALDRGDPDEADLWLQKVAAIEDIAPEPHVRSRPPR